MYIKLTRLDNSPIWINAAFVVTVEPRKGGGSVVVPIGDGLDYDVRETTEQVLAMLGDAPAPAVVPVPAPKMLAPTPEDVSPEPEVTHEEPSAGEEPTPAKRTRRTKKAAEDGEDAPKPAKRTVRRTKKAVAGESDGTPSGEEPPVAAPRIEVSPAAKPAADLPDAQLERLRKMMPRSVRKLLNTLAVQFKVADAEAVVAGLRERGVVEIEHEHVIWK